MGIVIVLVIIVAGGVVYLSVNEYKPDEKQNILVQGATTKPISPGDTVTAVTYSIGYGIHDSGFDCKAEGGTMSIAADKKVIEQNMEPILFNIKSVDPDIVFLQEVDRNSRRSFHYNEEEMIASDLEDYNSCFANNQLCSYVPTGLSGKTDAGLLSLTRLYAEENSERISLTEAEKWPESMTGTKDCMLVERVQLNNSSKQLVLINVQLTKNDMNLEQYKELDLLSHVKEVGTYLYEALDALKQELPVIVDHRGLGLIQGIELSEDVKAADVVRKAHENGLVLISAGCNVIRFIPPLIIEKEHVDRMIQILKKCF